MRTREVPLTLDDGPHDPPRIGWWLVTGPQLERDAYAIIELSWLLGDRDVPAREAYIWYLYRRSAQPFNSTGTYMEQIAHGVADTRDQALWQVTEAWTQMLGIL